MPRRVREYRPIASDEIRSWISMGLAVSVLLATALVALAVRGPDNDTTAVLRPAYYAAWTVFCLSYIVLSIAAFGRADAQRMRAELVASGPGSSRRARFWWTFNGGGGVWWALFGAAFTFGTLVELSISRASVAPWVMVLAIVVAVASLALIVVAFAVNYAREDAANGGLTFPGDESARFIDYVYFAAQVSTTFGGSDVSTTRSRMRRILIAHGAIAFSFNSVIVALLVSVLVSGIR